MSKVEEYEVGLIRTDRGEVKDKGNWGVDPAHPDFAGRADIANGSTDARAAFAAADLWAQQYGLDLVLSPGTYTIASDLTLTSGLKVPRGAVLKPASGVTVTINGAFDAGLYQVFDTSGGGSVEVRNPRPEWWGAAGDGATDDAAPMQAAFTATANQAEAQVILDPAATYRLDSPVTTAPFSRGTRALHIDGRGGGIYLTGTGSLWIRTERTTVEGVQFTQSSAVTASSTSYALDVLAVRDTLIRGCRFRQLKTVPIGVRAASDNSLDRLVVEGCTFFDNASGDIVLKGESSTYPARYISIVGNVFRSPDDPKDTGGNVQIRAIHVQPYTQDVTISGNVLYGPAAGNGATYTAGWRDAIMVGNSTGTGRPENVVITGNSITGMADDGVGLSGAVNVTINGNVIYGSVVTAGVYAPGDGTWSNEGIVVTGNRLHTHKLAGVYLKDTVDYVITGNSIEGISGTDAAGGAEGCGIKVVDAGGTLYTTRGVIEGNEITDVLVNGVRVDRGAVVVQGNMIDTFAQTAISTQVIDGAGIVVSRPNSTYSNNVINNGVDALYMYGSATRFNVTGNVGDALTGYGRRWQSGNTMDNYIIKNNNLDAATGASANEAAASATKLISDNL